MIDEFATLPANVGSSDYIHTRLEDYQITIVITKTNDHNNKSVSYMMKEHKGEEKRSSKHISVYLFGRKQF